MVHISLGKIERELAIVTHHLDLEKYILFLLQYSALHTRNIQ